DGAVDLALSRGGERLLPRDVRVLHLDALRLEDRAGEFDDVAGLVGGGVAVERHPLVRGDADGLLGGGGERCGAGEEEGDAVPEGHKRLMGFVIVWLRK